MGFLSNDSFLGRILEKVFQIVMINFMFLLGCIPIVTIGASFTGMYYACMRMLRYEDACGWRDFLKGFKDNLKQAVIVWLVLLAAVFVLSTNYRYGIYRNAMPWTMLCYAAAVSAAVAAILAMYIFPVMAAFEDSIRNLLQHCFFFVGKNILILPLIAFSNLFPIYLTYSDLELLPLYAFIWFFFGFAAIAYINSYFFLKLFGPYLPEQH